MIDFRYHLVSIVAVFLALTVGTVLGTTMLQDPLLHTLQSETADLREQSEDLRAEKDVADKFNAGGDELVAAYADGMLRDRLSGVRVAVLESPGTHEDMRKGVIARIEQAGGRVPGRLVFTDTYIDPEQSAFVNDLTDQLADGFELPEGTPHEQAGAVLARAVLRPADDRDGTEDGAEESGEDGKESGKEDGGEDGKESGKEDGGEDGKESDKEDSGEGSEEGGDGASASKDGSNSGEDIDAEAVLAGFAEAGLLTVQGEPAEKADIGILLAPAQAFADEGAPSPQEGEGPPGNRIMLDLARAFDRASDGAVIVGGAPSAGDNGLVAQARAEKAAYSTVDVAGRATGDVAAVLAVAAATDARSGHYGIGEGAEGFLPDPLPEGKDGDTSSQDRTSSPDPGDGDSSGGAD